MPVTSVTWMTEVRVGPMQTWMDTQLLVETSQKAFKKKRSKWENPMNDLFENNQVFKNKGGGDCCFDVKLAFDFSLELKKLWKHLTCFFTLLSLF